MEVWRYPKVRENLTITEKALVVIEKSSRTFGYPSFEALVTMYHSPDAEGSNVEAEHGECCGDGCFHQVDNWCLFAGLLIITILTRAEAASSQRKQKHCEWFSWRC